MNGVCAAAAGRGPPGCVVPDARRHHKQPAAPQRHRRPAPPPPVRRRRPTAAARALPADDGDDATQHVVLPESEGTTAAAAGSLVAEELEEAAADAAAAAVAAAAGEPAAEGGLLASKEVREMLAFAIPALGMVLAGGREQGAPALLGGARCGLASPLPLTRPLCSHARRPADELDRHRWALDSRRQHFAAAASLRLAACRAQTHQLCRPTAPSCHGHALPRCCAAACVGRVSSLQLAALGPNTALFNFAHNVRWAGCGRQQRRPRACCRAPVPAPAPLLPPGSYGDA